MLKSLLKVWPYLSRYKGSIIVAMILGAIMAQMSILLPASFKLLVDSFSGDLATEVDVVSYIPNFVQKLVPSLQNVTWLTSRSEIIRGIAMFLPIYFLCFGILRFFHYFITRYIAEKMANDVRLDMMKKMLYLNPSFYQSQKNDSGGLFNRTLNDTLVMQISMQYYTDLIREPFFVICVTTYLIYLNWQIMLFSLIFVPIFTTIIRIISKKLKRLNSDGQNALDIVSKNLKEGLDGIRVIQSYGLEDHLSQKYEESISYYDSLRKKIIKRVELASPLNEFIVSFFIAAIILWVAQLIYDGQETTGGFLAFLFAAGSLNQPIKKIQQAFVRLPGVAVSIERVFEIVDNNSQVSQLEKPLSVPMDWKKICYKDVSFAYAEERVLKNVSFEIERGKVYALVGQSGSGKSTLIHLLERFYDPIDGQVSIDQTSLSEFSLKELRQSIALVTQDVFLFNESVESNIRAGDWEQPIEKVIEAAEKANAMNFLSKLPDGLNTVCGERGSNFSGGEKQRISIARAIFKDAPILVLDEATSALDSASEVEVQKGIDSLMEGKTALIIAHRLSTISKADHILVMKDGEIVERGQHDELIAKKGVYENYHKLQAR